MQGSKTRCLHLLLRLLRCPALFRERRQSSFRTGHHLDGNGGILSSPGCCKADKETGKDFIFRERTMPGSGPYSVPNLGTSLRSCFREPRRSPTMPIPIFARESKPSSVGWPPRYSFGVTSMNCGTPLRRPQSCLDMRASTTAATGKVRCDRAGSAGTPQLNRRASDGRFRDRGRAGRLPPTTGGHRGPGNVPFPR